MDLIFCPLLRCNIIYCHEVFTIPLSVVSLPSLMGIGPMAAIVVEHGMDNTIPPSGIAFELEKENWNSFRIASDKSDRKKFGEMFDIPRPFLSGYSNTLRCVELHEIFLCLKSFTVESR
jgi:hypothetical protein